MLSELQFELRMICLYVNFVKAESRNNAVLYEFVKYFQRSYVEAILMSEYKNIRLFCVSKYNIQLKISDCFVVLKIMKSRFVDLDIKRVDKNGK
jgi:hypothetical protein